jgi:hypothetical protein
VSWRRVGSSATDKLRRVAPGRCPFKTNLKAGGSRGYVTRPAGDARRFSEGTHAVVVGVSSYARSGLKELPACEPEAAAVAAALVSSHACGVPPSQVHLLVGDGATPSAILEQLCGCAEAADADDILLFYFAGHGADIGQSFVLLTDAPGPADAPGLSREAIVDALARTKARGVLVILDCCGGASLAEHAPSYFHGLAGHDFRLLVSASRAGQSSWELADHGSLFTRRLLRVMRGEERLGHPGAVYFRDLFDYVYAGVVADAKREFGTAATQTPVFAGSLAGDPLLFINRDLTLAQVRVRMRRILPEDLRRRVALAVGGVLGVVVLSAGSYWAFLDSHKYLEILGDNIALVHGYPKLTGFGLPRTEWIYSFGPSDLRGDAPLTRDKALVLDARRTPEAVLVELLKPAPRGVARWAMGDREGARADLLQAAAEKGALDPTLLNILPEAVRAGDEERLDELIRRGDPDVAWQLVPALRELSPARAVAAIRASASSENLGFRLNLLSEWRGTCTPEVQEWLSGVLAQPGANVEYPVVAQAVLRTSGCTFPVSQAVEAPAKHIRSSLYALRLTDPQGSRELSRVVNDGLVKAQVDRHRPATVLARLAAFSRHQGSGPCAEWLIDPALGLDEVAMIDAGVAAARDCPGAWLEAVQHGAQVQLTWRQAGTADRLVAKVELTPTMDGVAIAMVDAMIEANAGNAALALAEMMTSSRSAELRLALARRLAALGVPTSDIEPYRLPNRPDLDRELLRWLALSNPQRAASLCADLILQGEVDSQLLGTLALIPISDDLKTQLQRAMRDRPALPRTIGVTLTGGPADVLELLLSQEPATRAVAAEYVIARDDHAAIMNEVKRMSVRADPLWDEVRRRSDKIKRITDQLAATPRWALEWRAMWIDHSEISDAGLALAFEQALERQWSSARR